MRRLPLALAALFLVTACSSTTTAAPIAATRVQSVAEFSPSPQLHAKAVAAKKLEIKIKQTIAKLKSRVGRTWYVYSGATPRGWDCSGLTRWTYEQLGIELPHSANKQAHLGTITKDPRPGDLVLFSYGGRWFIHAAIYLGNGRVIHAGFGPGQSTAVIKLSSRSFQGMTIRYVAVLPRPQNSLL